MQNVPGGEPVDAYRVLPNNTGEFGSATIAKHKVVGSKPITRSILPVLIEVQYDTLTERVTALDPSPSRAHDLGLSGPVPAPCRCPVDVCATLLRWVASRVHRSIPMPS